ncbi:MAG: CBS domain-containing protein, partial [Caldilineaceae bacterium]|nr:CBS domain-containing protein [Caldilineaceae bacterium]
MKASELMTSPAITVKSETPIRNVAAIMRKNQISGVPVVDAADKLLGIVTEINLIMRNAPIIGPNYISVLSG